MNWIRLVGSHRMAMSFLILIAVNTCEGERALVHICQRGDTTWMLKEVIISRSFLPPLLLTGEPALFHRRSCDKRWVVGTQDTSKKTSKCAFKKKEMCLAHSVQRRQWLGAALPYGQVQAHILAPSLSDSLSGCAEAKSRRIERGRRLPQGQHQRCSNFHFTYENSNESVIKTTTAAAPFHLV